MNVLLNGLRGSGKSTIGPLLAERLKSPFVDLDDRVLARFNETSVQAVWSAHGEQAWRSAEVSVLAEVLAARQQVIGLGGGVAMIPKAAGLIEVERSSGRAFVIYLRCDPQTLVQRLTRQPGDRPRLTNGALEAEVATIMQQRDPVYEKMADLVLDVTAMTPDDAAQAIAQQSRSKKW